MSGDEGELFPKVFGGFNGVCFLLEGEGLGDPCWGVPFFEGKSNRIIFRKIGDAAQIAEIEDITLRPAPTMTFLNPRPSTDSPGYPWRFDGQQKLIQLPLPLTYSELKEGAQIVVSGVTDAINVIQGTVEGELLVFRAGGLLIASVIGYEGAESLVDIDIKQDFTGEILAVNFDKAYKNLPEGPGLDGGRDDIVSYYNSDGIIARCTLNNVVISESANYIPSNGLLGNLVFQSKYIQDYGNVIEAYYWTNGRYLYILRLDDSYKMQAIQMRRTESPLQFPIL